MEEFKIRDGRCYVDAEAGALYVDDGRTLSVLREYWADRPLFLAVIVMMSVYWAYGTVQFVLDVVRTGESARVFELVGIVSVAVVVAGTFYRVYRWHRNLSRTPVVPFGTISRVDVRRRGGVGGPRLVVTFRVGPDEFRRRVDLPSPSSSGGEDELETAVSLFRGLDIPVDGPDGEPFELADWRERRDRVPFWSDGR